ncbi:MAG TPA: hypothetical protein VNJ11_13490 [Bryobacteraceae bacterium]|nr:hypothetical protein [Bryobacteraceae bacterium]
MAAQGVCVRICFLLVAALATGWRLGATDPLGVAVGGGTFWVDERPVAAHATVHEGSWIRAEDSALELRLFGGARLRLAAQSRAQVHAGRLVLERGAGEILPGPAYTFQARGLRVEADAGARGIVALRGERAVEVAAEEGALRVMREPRPLVAVVRAGTALRFEVQAPAGAQLPFEMTGCLERRDNRYVMRDLVTGILIEVRGRGLEREVGNVVEVTAVSLPGVQPAPGTQEVVQIRRLSRQRRGCPPAPSVAPAPPKPEAPPTPPPQPVPEVKPTPPAPAPRRGMSGAAKAVIAGVIIGGAGAGAAVFLTQREKETISP